LALIGPVILLRVKLPIIRLKCRAHPRRIEGTTRRRPRCLPRTRLRMTPAHRWGSILLACACLASRAGAEPKLDFARDIRPILANHCLACHGPDEKAREAELRLDLRDSALAVRGDRKPAVVPGKPDDSLLVRRIEHEKESRRMPPASHKKPLSEQQKQ